MVDYWEKLPSEIKGSKKKRFNYIMHEIYENCADKTITQPAEEEPEAYTISFSVKNGDGEGVNGATVILGDETKTTGSAGGCSFSDVIAGEYSVGVEADTYTRYTDSITVDEGSTSFIITLRKS